ncbi:MAG: glycosyltransferase family 4 protein [Caldilinea sp.]
MYKTPEPLHIALCPPEFDQLQRAMQGGAADATHIIQRYVAAGLQARGHTLTFLAPRNLEEVICTRDLADVRLGPQSWSASRWFAVAGKTAWRFQRWLGIPYLNVFSNYRLYDICLQCLPGHDLVYERNTLYRDGIARACRRLKLPYVLYIEADDILEHDIMGKPITGLLRWRARQTAQYNLDAADCVITVSEPTRLHLIAKWRVLPEKILVFPNAVDVALFRPDETVRRRVRASLGIAEAPLILFVGNFYEWHDVSTLLKAFAVTISTHPDARCVLVGDGAKRKAMEQLAAELGISNAVTFTGLLPHAEVAHMAASADIAVVPYPVLQQELWLSPLKLYEYMASGAAIVASSIGQITQVIEDGRSGLLTPPEDISGMARAFCTLIDDRPLRLQLAAQARNEAVQKHSWEHYLSRLEGVFAGVLAGQPVNSL